MAFKHVWWCFLMYLQILDHEKTQNPVNFWDFGKYLAKTGKFLGKRVPKLQIAISQKHVFAIYFCCGWAMKLKFGQVREQMDIKRLYYSDFWIFDFQPHIRHHIRKNVLWLAIAKHHVVDSGPVKNLVQVFLKLAVF